MKKLKKLKRKRKKSLISQQRLRIIEDYNNKEKQIELQKRIEYSHLVDENRLSVRKARDHYIQISKDAARKRLILLTKDRSKYATILVNLFAQRFFTLMEKDITI